MENIESKKDPSKECLKDLVHYIEWARMDDGIFLNIEPLKRPIIHTTKDRKKWLLLATLSGSNKDKDRILKYLSENVRYDGQKITFHGCYLPGDIFAYIELPTPVRESTIIDIANDTEKMITDKSMEYDAEVFIHVAKMNIEMWEKSLERGKQGKPCNFKDVSKKIGEIRREIIDDKDGVLGNKHVLFIDTTRCLNLIHQDLYNLISSTQQWMVKQFSSGLAREEAVVKARKKIEDYEDKLTSIKADKKDYRWSFLLDEFDEMIDLLKDLVSPDKSSKAANINQILESFSDILENIGLQIDIAEDEEDKKMIMKQYTYGKELTNKIISVTKSTVGYIYGSLVTTVMR